jgi:hypothetical protein
VGTGLFLFEIRDVFFQLGKETVDMKQENIPTYVRQELELRAFDTYHSLLWKDAEYIALAAFRDGYSHNGYGYR